MLILLEHYKLQLSIVLPKIAGLIKRAKQKGNQQKLEKTKQASKCLIWNFNLSQVSKLSVKSVKGK